MSIELIKPVCVFFLKEPVFLRAIDSVSIPIYLRLEDDGVLVGRKLVAELSTADPVGRPVTIFGVRYTRTLVDGNIVARRGEFLIDNSLAWDWPSPGRERKASFQVANVTVHDGELEKMILSLGEGMTANGKEFAAWI